MRIAWLLLLLAASLPAQRPPNLVLIFADDLGYGDLSAFGAVDHETPRLDRMADEGAKLTSFYVPTPFCAPSRATILTGRYPFRNGMVTNPAPDAGKNDDHLPLSEITLAEALKPAGYATAAIGKWHLGHLPEYLPTRQGFDEYYGILYSNDMRPVQIVENEEVAEYPVNQNYLTRDYTRKAIDFIERNRDEPFFLYLPHAMPHKPLAASEEFYTPDTPDDLYSDVIRELDHYVGVLLDRIAELGLEDDTLVVFTSDNGPWFGGYTAGLRGMKSISWEGGHRVPMIARWPGQIPEGRVSDAVVGSINIFPTFLEAAGVEPPEGVKLDGASMLDLLKGETEESPNEAILTMAGRGQLRAVRQGKWKLHVRSPGPERRYMPDASHWFDPRGPDGVTIIAPYEQPRPDQYPGLLTGGAATDGQLFDLEADRGEQRDVAGEHPEVVARLRAFFERMEAEVPEFQPSPGGGGGLLHLMGGELRYDRVIEPQR